MSLNNNMAEWPAVPDAAGVARLAARLGNPASALAVSGCPEGWRDARVHDVASLRRALEDYRDRVIVSWEFPAILAAHGHASRAEARELVALDQRLARVADRFPFAEASRRAGRRQLARLRPLRGQRVVGRYLEAIERGDAQGWHTVVHGVTLALFSIPLRQGLAHYAQITLRAFIEAHAEPLRLSEDAAEAVWRDICAPLGPAVERLGGFPAGFGLEERPDPSSAPAAV